MQQMSELTRWDMSVYNAGCSSQCSRYIVALRRATLLHLYRSLIRSKLYYGAIVYGSARKSYLRMLDPIQNQALRLCLGAFRTSPATSLHVEANEMPMELRRRRLASQYSLKICSNLSNPARNCAFNERFTKLFDKRSNQIRPLGLRIKTDLSAIGFKQKDIFTSSIYRSFAFT